ncbi:MAG: peptide chain release factor 1 [Candidatus Marinimicrobia bacterium]|nr:peptide chain release factor 1 [Candidatus Neomarinimicrobiota bacterium]
MLEKLKQIKERYDTMMAALSDPGAFQDQDKFKTLSRERKHLEPIVQAYEKYARLVAHIADDEAVLRGNDDELKELVKEELDTLRTEREEMEEDIKFLLIPPDPNDDKNTIVEIRAGTGGDEAALFAADLYRMYTRYAERQNWKMEDLSASFMGGGGVKEITFQIRGESAYGQLKYESGVHRVQRVPATESSGRIHTSAATVAVLPEAEKVDVEINESDLRIDTYRASGAGGQHVNKTDSAIRVTHIPSGLVVACQDERSQHKNKEKALKILYSRLLQHTIDEQNAAVAAVRRSQVSTGDRSAKIRTYNFPQMRVTDHRINYTSHQLQAIMDGDLYDMIEQLKLADNVEKLKNI